MMADETLDLFDSAYARRTDPDTSQDAADAMTDDRLTELAQAALDGIRAHPEGITAQDLARLTGYDHNTISPRLRPLANKGLIHDSGERRIPLGKTRATIVWKIGPSAAWVAAEKEHAERSSELKPGTPSHHPDALWPRVLEYFGAEYDDFPDVYEEIFEGTDVYEEIFGETDVEKLMADVRAHYALHGKGEDWIHVECLLDALAAEHARANRLRLELEEEHIAYLKLLDRLNAK